MENKDERFALEKGERSATVAAHDVQMLPNGQEIGPRDVNGPGFTPNNSPVFEQRRLKVHAPPVKPPLNSEGRDFCVKFNRHSAWKEGKKGRKIKQQLADRKLKPEKRRAKKRLFGKRYSSDCEGDGPAAAAGRSCPVCADQCPYQVRRGKCGKHSHFHKKDALKGKARREQENAVFQGVVKKGVSGGFFPCQDVEACNKLQVMRPHHHTEKEVTAMRTKIKAREKASAQAKSDEEAKQAKIADLKVRLKANREAKEAANVAAAVEASEAAVAVDGTIGVPAPAYAASEAKDDVVPAGGVNENQTTARNAVPVAQGPAATVHVTPELPAKGVCIVQPTAGVAVPVSQGPAANEQAPAAPPDHEDSDSDVSVLSTLPELGADGPLVLGAGNQEPFEDDDHVLEPGPKREATMYCYLPEEGVDGVAEMVGEVFHTIRAGVAVAVMAIPAIVATGDVGERSRAAYNNALLRFYPEFMSYVPTPGLVSTHAATRSLRNRGTFGQNSAYLRRTTGFRPVVSTMYNRSWVGPVWTDLFDLLVKSPIATRRFLQVTVVGGVAKLTNPESVVQAMLAALQVANRRDVWLAEPVTVINTLTHAANQLTFMHANLTAARGATVDPTGAPPVLGPPSSTF